MCSFAIPPLLILWSYCQRVSTEIQASVYFYFFLLRCTGPSCSNSNSVKIQNKSNNFSSALGGKKKQKSNNKKTYWTEMINTYSLTTETIYICKSTFVLIMLWNENSNKEAHCDQPTTVPLALSTFHLYIIWNFSLVPLICMNTCHYNPQPSQKNIINKKTGDLIGPWGKMWNTK